MGPRKGGRGPSSGKNKPGNTKERLERRKQAVDDLQALEKAVEEFDPKIAEHTTFSDLPLSEPTASGLQASHFQVLTDIQAGAIPLALRGRDVLGAAKTGSGKTLAFLVPVLEKLYRARWTEFDGLGALIISPTRELAVQIFDVLRKVGRNHIFSAGLVIGGKSLKEEAERLQRMNILVCTPGRMLQHLDQTVGFDANNLQILVLDEADRIMDVTFESGINALVEHLPKSRQTLMFSATQSRKVADLARLSLKDPDYVSVHETATAATPSTLQQHYIVTPLSEKLDTLYGFIKSNLKSKILVFFSTAKQDRFAFEALRRLQPGIPLLHQHGRQKQTARLEITARFSSAQHSCLFATDIVARGVDFPAVDWVVQVDAPENVDTYIHRVGRTARYEKGGRAVLFLDPSEEDGFLKRLEHKKVPIQRVHIKEKKKQSIKEQLQEMCFQNPDIKYLAQKSLASYAKSIYIQKDRDVFKLESLDLDALATAIGLPGLPQIKYQKGEDVKRLKNAPRMHWSSGSETGSDADNRKEKRPRKGEVRTKYDRMFGRTNQDVLSSHYTKLIDHNTEGSPESQADEDADFLTVKRVLDGEGLDKASGHPGEALRVVDLGGTQPLVIDSKRREKMLKSKKKMLKYRAAGERIVFDDEGNPHRLYELINDEEFQRAGPVEVQRQRFIEEETARVRDADVDDKQFARDKRREKREKRKAREALERGEEQHVSLQPRLASPADDEDPLALLASLPLAGGPISDEEDEQNRRPKKKARKWFEDDSDHGRPGAGIEGKGKVIEADHEPETLEDLEALAAGLLES